LRGCSGNVLAISPSDFGCTETGVRHSNDDFDNKGWPSYQHLRPSMKRHDQYPCRFDGAELHCCFASAFGTMTGENKATTQTTNATDDLICFLILKGYSLLQSTHGHNQLGPFENFHQFVENSLVVQAKERSSQIFELSHQLLFQRV
jgi:hypothetical protein